MNTSMGTTLRTAKSYLDATKILFRENRNDKFPYIIDLGLEAHPMQQNIGQALELFFKVFIYSKYDPEIDYKHITLLEKAYCERFKGNKSLLNRIAKHDLNTHDLRFLLVLCNVLDTNHFFKTLNDGIAGWQYHNRQHSTQIEPIIYPDISDFRRATHNLNIRYDRPFDTRYPIKGYKHIPNIEILIAGASNFYEELQLVH